MPISFETYQRVALEDREGQWELVHGRLREKPVTTVKRGLTQRFLVGMLTSALGVREWSVGSARVRISTGTCYIPDVAVIPMTVVLRLDPEEFEVYSEPLPLVAEVWSPSIGEYDVDGKLPEYQLRGDLEVWRIHPYERTLTVWRRRPDGSYAEETYRGGTVQPAHLPNVTIDLDTLFE